MLKATRDLVLPTTITGSLPRPHWYTASLEGRSFGEKRMQVEFQEQYMDALAAYFSDQRRAGLDIFVDGDCRFDRDIGGRSWIAYPLERMQGLGGHSNESKFESLSGAPVGHIMRELLGGQQWPEVTGPLAPGEMQYAMLWKLAQQLSSRPVKFGTISAQCLERFVGNRHYSDDDELLAALCDAMNAELREVAAAGCSIIQIEDPAIHFAAVDPEATTGEIEKLIDAFNREVRGVDAEIWYHACWGNPSQQRITPEPQSYERALEWMVQCDCDVITLETASSQGTDLPLLKTIDTTKKFAIGVIDHRNMQVETPEQVAGLIRQALEYVPQERLIVTTDCGFGREGVPRRNALYKMISLVQGTNLVRRDLGLQEAEVPAANPQLAL
ncbi:MAG: cobalamin-independent methionine synthase II family protein [bacterium]|nr:cobalamin-independent methionine synthase II family protein [bacterium]